MPFNGSNRIEALFAFVDQYVAGDPALRSGFDQVVGDLVTSVNALATYLEGLTATGIDQRYLGRVVDVPTQRADTTALQAGDFYVSGHVDAGRVGLAYVYDGAAFDVVSDFSIIGAFFKDALSSAATPAAARSALELGTMATQNTGSFAPASVATDVALAIKLLADGIAKSMTSNDWDNAHLAGPGTTMVQANAAALNAPVALNAAGIYVAYDANNGFVLAVAHSTGQVYYRMRVAGVWGTWREIATANLTAAEGDILYRGASAWTRLAKGTAGQFLRQNSSLTAPVWSSRKSISAAKVTTSGTAFDETGIASTVDRIDLVIDGVSLSGSDDFLVQMIVSGVPVTAGYLSSVGVQDGVSANTFAATTGFILRGGAAATALYGRIVIEKSSGNMWTVRGSTAGASGVISYYAGRITLAGVADGVRLTRSGTNTFDAGQFFVEVS